uniref:Midasin n=1 Tax=Dermatophagoides pteronyssinus TaxID=6956 RepID=A0A6P6YBR7_DERPT|nr:midasin-like [Dermatophagoides pteronyssinus]
MSQFLKNKKPILLVGPAGTGKTHLSSLVLKQDVIVFNVHDQTESSDLIGTLQPVTKLNRLIFHYNQHLISQLTTIKECLEVIENLLTKFEEFSSSQNLDSHLNTAEIRAKCESIVSNNTTSTELKEPLLLIGGTGLGKTSVIQEYVSWAGKMAKKNQKLYIVNCQQGTEASDFLGCFIPNAISKLECDDSLFKWQNGPLVNAALNGDILLIDEINLAEDSVLERLNSVFEGENSSLYLADQQVSINIHADFRVYATMNPSGDYGKKELSPALRNRFLEVWTDVINLDDEKAKILLVAIELLGTAFGLKLTDLQTLVTFFLPDGKNWVHFNALEIVPTQLQIGEITISQSNLTKLLLAFFSKRPILIEGKPGVGKTCTIEWLAKVFNKKLYRFNMSDQSDLFDLLGSYSFKNENFVWKIGGLTSAILNGDWVLIDEINLAPQSILEGLNSLFDFRNSLYISQFDETLVPTDGFRLFATQNKHSYGTGRKGLPISFLNRFAKLELDCLSTHDIFFILEQRYPKLSSKISADLSDEEMEQTCNEELGNGTGLAEGKGLEDAQEKLENELDFDTLQGEENYDNEKSNNKKNEEAFETNMDYGGEVSDVSQNDADELDSNNYEDEFGHFSDDANSKNIDEDSDLPMDENETMSKINKDPDLSDDGQKQTDNSTQEPEKTKARDTDDLSFIDDLNKDVDNLENGVEDETMNAEKPDNEQDGVQSSLLEDLLNNDILSDNESASDIENLSENEDSQLNEDVYEDDNTNDSEKEIKDITDGQDEIPKNESVEQIENNDIAASSQSNTTFDTKQHNPVAEDTIQQPEAGEKPTEPKFTDDAQISNNTKDQNEGLEAT